MQINVPGSGSAAKKHSDLTLNRFLRHPVEEAFNDTAFTFQTPLLSTAFNGYCHLRGATPSLSCLGSDHLYFEH